MNKSTSIKANFIYNLIYQILAIITPLITTPYLSRNLGPKNIGTYSFSYSIASYFVMLAMLGINNYGNREIAKIRDNIRLRSKKFWSIYFMQLFTGCLSLLIYLIYVILFSTETVGWIMTLYVVSGILDVNWYFFGCEKFKVTVTRNILIKLFTVVCILLFVKGENGLYAYSLIMCGGMLLSQLAIWPLLLKELKYEKVSLNEIFSHIKPNVVLFVPVIAVSLYKIMDKIMLGVLTTYTEVGFYESTERVTTLPNSCIIALGTVMLPRISNLNSIGETNKSKDYIKKSMIFSVFISIPLSIGLASIADVFVPFFYGNGYDQCIPLFNILLPSCIFAAFANVIRTQYLIPNGYDKEYLISVSLGAIINLVGNYVLIPISGAVGAAVCTLLAEIVVCFYQTSKIKDYCSLTETIRVCILFVLVGLLMYSTVSYIPIIKGYVLTLILKIIVGGIVYLPLCFLIWKRHLKKFDNLVEKT